MRLHLLAIGLGACCHPMTPAAPATPDLAALGAPGLRVLDAGAFEASVRYLASDELAGRAPGTAGGRQAEQYVADQFAKLGLEPAGEHGTYFQDVPLRIAERSDGGSSLVIHAHDGDVTLAAFREAVLYGDPHASEVALDTPLVFAGYGIARPDLGFDDLQGVDVRGAIVVVFGGAPRTIDGRPVDTAVHAVLSDLDERTIALREHGARGVIAVYDPVRAGRMPFEIYVPKVTSAAMAWLDHGQPASAPALPKAVISEAAFDRVLAAIPGAPHARVLWAALDRGERPRVDLGATAHFAITSKHRDVIARNVVARLPGRGAHAGETVVYTAHLDHLGIGPAVDDDAIYNGALDNASGVAGMLEVARAFTVMPAGPRRSLLFVAVTGEEEGLLGSDFFVRHPTIPAERLVANINLDGIGLMYEPFDMIPIGAEHSTLGAHTAAAARAAHMTISPDPEPEQVFFIRSDQYSFVQRGIPAVFPGTGYRDAHGATDENRRAIDAWSEMHYHRPSDEWLPEFRASWAIKELGFDFLLGLSVATGAERPRWNAGDVFAPR